MVSEHKPPRLREECLFFVSEHMSAPQRVSLVFTPNDPINTDPRGPDLIPLKGARPNQSPRLSVFLSFKSFPLADYTAPCQNSTAVIS